MADRSTDRAPSVSSSGTEAEAYHYDEKEAAVASTDVTYTRLKTPEELEIGDDVEGAGLLPEEPRAQEQSQPAAASSLRSAFIWMVVNTAATIGIVSPC
jgi:solute carrier family 35 protein E3